MAAAADERGLDVLTAVVDALHAQVCRMEVLMASWYAREGLPVPDGLPVLPRDPEAGTAVAGDPAAALPRAARRRRIEAMGLHAV